MTSTDQATDVFARFLNDDRSRVLAFKGPWGVGKSYFIRKFLKSDAAVPSVTSYASLFGLRSIQEVRDTIVGCFDAREDWKKNIKLKAANLAKFIKPSLFGQSLQLPDLNSAAFWNIARSEKVLLVLDDLERMHADLHLEQVLGLASNLTENSKAKIVIVFNEDNLQAGFDAIARYREKVIDVEFLFKPNSKELISTFLNVEGVQNIVSDCLEISGGPNIRVIQHINRTLLIFQSAAAKVNQRIGTNILENIALTTWLFYVSPVALTSDIYQVACEKLYGGFDEEQEGDEKILKLLEMMKQLKPTHLLGGINHQAIQFLRSGYIDEAALKQYLSNEWAAGELKEYEKKIKEAYQPYIRNFIPDVEQCVQPVEAVLEEYADRIDLDAMLRGCTFIENCDKPTGHLWLKHIRAKLPNMSDQTCRSYLAALKDEDAILLIEEHLASSKQSKDVYALVDSISEKETWAREDIEYLNSLSSDYYMEWFRTEQRTLLPMLRSALRIFRLCTEGSDESKLVKKLEQVIRSLAKESLANELRMINFFNIAPE